MNITAEKQLIKTQIDKLTDEHLIKAIKELLTYAEINHETRLLKPFTKQQIIKRALASENDIENGKTTSLKDLRKAVKKW